MQRDNLRESTMMVMATRLSDAHSARHAYVSRNLRFAAQESGAQNIIRLQQFQLFYNTL